MSTLEATIQHFATRAKAYVAAIYTALAGVDLTFVPQPYARYLAIALPVLGFITVFKVPNRREVLDADVEAARALYDAIKAAGAPATTEPHEPAGGPPPAPVAPAPVVVPEPVPAPVAPQVDANGQPIEPSATAQ